MRINGPLHAYVIGNFQASASAEARGVNGSIVGNLAFKISHESGISIELNPYEAVRLITFWEQVLTNANEAEKAERAAA